METKLIQTTSQKLILAPQLRQFLKLLELPVFELKQQIDQELTENPTLEELNPLSEPDELAETDSMDSPNQTDLRKNDLPESDEFEALTAELQTTDHHRHYDFSQNGSRDLQKKRDYQESILTKPATLGDYLEWQLGILELTSEEKEIARQIIGNINDDGWLVTSAEEIANGTNASVGRIQNVLEKIQTLDPPGVGGRNLQEILLIQLKRQGEDTSLAQKMIQEHLSMLERKHLDQIARSLKISIEKVKAAVRQIAQLEPKPGRIFYEEKPNYIIPDAAILIDPEHEDNLLVEVTDEVIPELRINAMYRRMLKDKNTDPQTRIFLKERIQSAVELIRALGQRKSTIRQITEEIAKAQHEFFFKGFAHLKPLRLKDLAEKIKVHESTISRAIQRKYIVTPFGTIPYKHFFSSKLEMADGTEESQRSVMEQLKALINAEDKRKPFSDSKLVQILSQKGINVARRTIAKYRELLNILPTHLRKQK